jgi:2-dehydro-3-deoxyphosphogluconate aldolase/(4S)-4-hydroxy-2-oxoglutarate aldolase
MPAVALPPDLHRGFMRHAIFDHFNEIGVIPVVEIDSAQDAKPLAEALLAGGLPVAEITLRTDAALESIRVIALEGTDVIVEAGTVINREQAQATFGWKTLLNICR